jgi:hypothetical protein
MKKLKQEDIELKQKISDMESEIKELELKRKDVDFISQYDRKLSIANSAKLEEQKKNKHLNKLITELESEIDIRDELDKHILNAEQLSIKKDTTRTKSKGIANIVFSDWHTETPIDYRSVHDKNRFNPDIAEKRIDTAIKKSLRLIEIERQTVVIDELVLALLGDFMSGEIHDELKQANVMLPTVANVWLYKRLKAGIDYYLKCGKFKKIKVICHVGNHSRTTKKKEYIDYARKSWEWLLYTYLAIAYKGNPKVEFHIPLSYHTYLKEYDVLLRFHHGDQINFRGGVYGVAVPATKKIKDWNDSIDKATIDVFGHFHTYSTPNNFICNGSLCGYNPMADMSGYKMEKPKQAFFLIHEKLGLIVNRPIYVE